MPDAGIKRYAGAAKQDEIIEGWVIMHDIPIC